MDQVALCFGLLLYIFNYVLNPLILSNMVCIYLYLWIYVYVYHHVQTRSVQQVGDLIRLGLFLSWSVGGGFFPYK